MNKVILIGNLTKDPEITSTTGGVSVTKFTVAVSRKFKNAEGEYESDFINCVAWRNTAEFVHKYFKKGQKLAVIGSIQTRNYDAQDGTKRYVTEVVAEEVEFVEKRSTGDNGGIQKEVDKLEPIEDDTLPF
ncbi:MAG: single-stranded DNA-binding protein [Tenericutes bacterium HGW-Tenericutes-4]|nr:MAG: single-stranded DNA-binding protein [Tenericutes bacterium HGW-Tenericutes-4]